MRIWAAHRIGMLEIGDPALVCAVSAAHRGQAFAVCSELVDRIKEQVPIWKEQFFADGTVEWVGAGSCSAAVGCRLLRGRSALPPTGCEVTHVRRFRPAPGPTVGLTA